MGRSAAEVGTYASCQPVPRHLASSREARNRRDARLPSLLRRPGPLLASEEVHMRSDSFQPLLTAQPRFAPVHFDDSHDAGDPVGALPRYAP